ncbi:MAG: isocitrate lyase/phosphoenolpyruvate mutase family protein [Xenococcaceae cyanobacterium]
MNAKVEIFKKLHEGEMFLLPNAWDAVSARIYASMGFKAIATSSGAIAFARGYEDGENIPWPGQLEGIRNIVNAVKIPVSADIECGYADDLAQLENHINQLIDIGVVGINIEDSNKHGRNGVKSIEEQSAVILRIHQTADNRNYPLFINARTDVYVTEDYKNNALEETIKRAAAYKECGANSIFPLGMLVPEHIKTLIAQTGVKVSVHGLPGNHDLKKFRDAGACRYTFGYMGLFYTASKLRSAVKAMLEDNDATELFSFDENTMAAIQEN